MDRSYRPWATLPLQYLHFRALQRWSTISLAHAWNWQRSSRLGHELDLWRKKQGHSVRFDHDSSNSLLLHACAFCSTVRQSSLCFSRSGQGKRVLLCWINCCTCTTNNSEIPVNALCVRKKTQCTHCSSSNDRYSLQWGASAAEVEWGTATDSNVGV